MYPFSSACEIDSSSRFFLFWMPDKILSYCDTTLLKAVSYNSLTFSFNSSTASRQSNAFSSLPLHSSLRYASFLKLPILSYGMGLYLLSVNIFVHNKRAGETVFSLAALLKK